MKFRVPNFIRNNMVFVIVIGALTVIFVPALIIGSCVGSERHKCESMGGIYFHNDGLCIEGLKQIKME